MTQDYHKTQRVIKIGNSHAITLDKDFVKATGIKQGDNVETVYDPDAKKAALTVRDKGTAEYANTPKQKLTSKITPELQEWTEKFIDTHSQALEELANL